VLRWWLAGDRLEEGQWLNGRIYERRCDLSPNGDLLIYFAAKWQTPYETWTAVSRTPYLTALALWPKGDAWGGGGMFEGSQAIGINHLSTGPVVVPGAQAAKWHPLGLERETGLPAGYSLRRWGEYAGRGEDNPILHERATRDGWVLIAQGESGPHRQSGYGWLFESPEIYERKSPTGDLTLRRYLRAIYQRNGPWYVEDFEIIDSAGNSLRMIERCSWADWDSNGDVLIALHGRLCRLPAVSAKRAAPDPMADAALVADLAPLRFKNVVAPDWAKRWP